MAHSTEQLHYTSTFLSQSKQNNVAGGDVAHCIDQKVLVRHYSIRRNSGRGTFLLNRPNHKDNFDPKSTFLILIPKPSVYFGAALQSILLCWSVDCTDTHSEVRKHHFYLQKVV